MWIYHGGLGDAFNMYPKWSMSETKVKRLSCVQTNQGCPAVLSVAGTLQARMELSFNLHFINLKVPE